MNCMECQLQRRAFGVDCVDHTPPAERADRDSNVANQLEAALTIPDLGPADLMGVRRSRVTDEPVSVTTKLDVFCSESVP